MQRAFSFGLCTVWCRSLRLVSPVLLATVLLASCSGLNFAASTTPTTVLANLHWCGKPLLVFRDEGASTAERVGTVHQTAIPIADVSSTISNPRTITDWKQVEPNLGFTIYLPEALPIHTCLTSASGTIHDPILGGSFTIGYLLPDHSAISLAEAPLRSKNATFQCSPAPISANDANGETLSGANKGVQSLVCRGAHGSTNIVFAAKGSMDELQKFFDALQPGVDWIPSLSTSSGISGIITEIFACTCEHLAHAVIRMGGI
ncbi:MAG: hypothetical protein JO125_16595 [Chloroflexi bacterium]|nr:hypothetical protein [Ktedonobacteraceae bacterium]MBV8822720.1 hypothetical protein [Ktedonobacteraceae bacterium]MBV9019415.1 hypothetical protein [Ktedonobacteraceae bacterium]MBV9709016.1 hypothetical protein [Chloroflexota bacterium]